MYGEQIRLQVPPRLFGVNSCGDDQAVNTPIMKSSQVRPRSVPNFFLGLVSCAGVLRALHSLLTAPFAV